jgi:hypothetical protein
MVTVHPDRFAVFTTLPVTVPDAAAAELERAVGELGFVGTMISGTIGGRFLDDPFFSPVLETAARLDVPVYLHPDPPPKPVANVYYTGFPGPVNQALATAGYGWHYETSLHAVRMIIGGVFDRLPGLKVILGHLGEGIPFHLPHRRHAPPSAVHPSPTAPDRRNTLNRQNQTQRDCRHQHCPDHLGR